MGGYNSGRWGSYTKKTTVEECRTLNLAQLERAGLFRFPGRDSVRGSLQWSNPTTGKESASMGFILERTDTDVLLTLAYKIGNDEMRVPVRIETAVSNFGGICYWGECPDCGRRVRKLYLTPGGRRFSCRTCLGLTYESAQKAHRFDGLHRLVAESLGVPLEKVRNICRGK